LCAFQDRSDDAQSRATIFLAVAMLTRSRLGLPDNGALMPGLIHVLPQVVILTDTRLGLPGNGALMPGLIHVLPSVPTANPDYPK
jgi:hypothetical protein